MLTDNLELKIENYLIASFDKIKINSQDIQKDDVFIATGTSCRKQISDIFSTKSTHLSQIFAKSLNN